MHVEVQAPDRDGRRDIFKYYLDKVCCVVVLLSEKQPETQVKCADDVDVEVLAKQTVGFVGADIENVVNSAALRAAAEGFSAMHQQHLDEARDRITLGALSNRQPDDTILRLCRSSS